MMVSCSANVAIFAILVLAGGAVGLIRHGYDARLTAMFPPISEMAICKLYISLDGPPMINPFLN